MALEFRIETLETCIRFNIKGVKVELAYHAASTLCNAIMVACQTRREFAATKYMYWKQQSQNGKMVKVNKANQQEYEQYVKSLGIDISTLEQSQRGKCTKRKLAKPKTPTMSREERKEQKIRELQMRYHITTKK